MPRSSSKRRSKLARDVLTTREAAEICKVALSTVVYWYDKGLIRGYRTPGGHRRIFRADLEKFMREYSMPLGHRLEDDHLRVLCVVKEAAVLDACRKAVKKAEGRYELAQDGFEAGRLVALFEPNLVLLDEAIPGLDCLSVCRHLQAEPEIEVVVLLSEGGDAELYRRAGAVLARPIDRRRLRQLVSKRLSSIQSPS
ncbi:helix-turn-helix domain-containing protein [Myxococcota bacterium]